MRGDHRTKLGLVWLGLVSLGLGLGPLGCSRHHQAPVAEDGAALFAKKCAECHQEDPDNDMRAPTPQALRLMSRSAILAIARDRPDEVGSEVSLQG